MSQVSFTYNLPPERIAQRPVERGKSRLLVARRESGELYDSLVSSLSDFLRAGDLLILNNSKVIPCRFFVSLGKRTAELFLVFSRGGGVYEALANPMAGFKPGAEVSLSPKLSAKVLGRTGDGKRLLLEVASSPGGDTPLEVLIEEDALMPIPPYIREGKGDELDRGTYQTIYAREAGSIAAPTAGFHFTEALLGELREKGINSAFLTLHVGTASFLAAEKQDPALQKTEREEFYVPDITLSHIEATKKACGRIVAVGTTTVRALESLSHPELGVTQVTPRGYLSTSLFIRPPFQFRTVDCLLTNFHQPASTHLYLVEAFAGRSLIENAYTHALGSGYRFLSYGDAMLLL